MIELSLPYGIWQVPWMPECNLGLDSIAFEISDLPQPWLVMNCKSWHQWRGAKVKWSQLNLSQKAFLCSRHRTRSNSHNPYITQKSLLKRFNIITPDTKWIISLLPCLTTVSSHLVTHGKHSSNLNYSPLVLSVYLHSPLFEHNGVHISNVKRLTSSLFQLTSCQFTCLFLLYFS